MSLSAAGYSCSGGLLSPDRRMCDRQGRPSGALQLGKGAPALWMGAKGQISFTLCTQDAALAKSRRGKKHTGNTLLCESLPAVPGLPSQSHPLHLHQGMRLGRGSR